MARTGVGVVVAAALALLIASAAPAAAARRLAADTLTGSGVDKSYYSVALTATGNAEAVTNPRISGLAHNAATIAAVASTRFPATATKTATKEIEPKSMSKQVTKDLESTPVELPVAAFGTLAVAQTSGGASAVAGSEAMPLAAPEGTSGTSRGTTLGTFNPSALRKGTGASKKAMTESIGVTYDPAGAFAQSGMGDGPHALARAGEAVAAAYSGADHPLAPEPDLLGGYKPKRAADARR